MDRRKLGSQGLEVSAEGLGCMGMTRPTARATRGRDRDDPPRARPRRQLLDTAEVTGRSRTRSWSAARSRPPRRVVVATKFGFVRPRRADDARHRRPPRARARAIDGSLRRLGIDHIDLYYQHRVDPDVPIEETVGAMGERAPARSATSASRRRRRRRSAARTTRILSPRCRASTRCGARPRGRGPAELRELGIGFVAYSPLGRGFLTGQIRSIDDLPETPARTNPRFPGDAFEANLRLAEPSRTSPRARSDAGADRARMAAAKGDDIVPIPGTKSPSGSRRTPRRPTSSSPRTRWPSSKRRSPVTRSLAAATATPAWTFLNN